MNNRAASGRLVAVFLFGDFRLMYYICASFTKTQKIMQLLPTKECPPPTDGTVFLAFNAYRYTYQVVWFNAAHKHFKITPGDFYGHESNPSFTHWCKLPVLKEINEQEKPGAPSDTIKEYAKWKERHPNEDYQLDEIGEFFASIGRSEKFAIMEYLLTNSNAKNEKF